MNSFKEIYDFDPVGRLVKVSSSHDPTLGLEYDVIGNLIAASDVGVLDYDPSSRPHAVRKFLGVEQHYDSVGNHLGDETRRRVEYNALDLPNNIFRRSDGKSIQIRYDAEGNRAATHGPEGDRYYLGPIEMRGGLFAHRVQVGGRTVAQAMRKDGDPHVEIAYVHDDHLGSTDLVTDKSGNVQARFSYDAWGARRERAWTRTLDGPDGPLVDHGYTGHEHDDEWGVIHMRGRAYDPAMRRMTSVDPFVVNPFGVQAFNRYSYVLNDPVNLIDPSGYTPKYPHDPCASQRCTIIHFGTGSTVYGEKGAPGPVSEDSPNTVEVRSAVDRASVPNLDAAVHRVTQTALNGLDQGTVWGNPSPTNVAGAINRFSSNPGLGAGEALAYTYVRGTLENVDTASNANASTGDRAAASGWLLFDVLGGAIVGMVAKWARGGATAVNVADDAANAIYRMTNAVDQAVPASTPVGRVGRGPMTVQTPGTNRPATIGGRDYTGHALDRMQQRGLVPSVVEDAIAHGTATPGRMPGTTAHYSAVNNVTVITDTATGRVITTYPGAGKGF